MTTKYFVAGEGALWIQPDGPNTKPQFLGCHELGDVTIPKGTLNLMYCPDPSKPKAYKVVGSYRSAPGAITTSIEVLMSKVADYLERVDCPVPIFIHKVECGRKDVFAAYQRSVVLVDAEVTSRGLSGMVSRDPDAEGESMQNFDIEAQDYFDAFGLSIERQSTTETEALNDIHFCGDEICEGDCGEAQSICELGYAVGDAAAGSPSNQANVLETEDGSTWAATSTNPFGAAEDIAAVSCFSIGGGNTRILVGRGSTDAGNPAEIAYSDDGGATWTNVNVGSVNGQYFMGRDSIFVLDIYNIWAVTSGGYIYFSGDGGATWTAQESGVITAGDYYGISFANADDGFAVAAADIIARTVDGGATWSAVTATGGAGDLLTVKTISQLRAWVGDDEGDLYFTKDGGTTWTSRSFSGSGSGEVRDIEFYNDYVGALIHNSATPVGSVHVTIDGGYTWQAITTPTNTGLNSIFICSPYLMYAVGEVQGSTAVILKVHD
jgi:photosystem II stability/assembly factor-like uncharacterized protein